MGIQLTQFTETGAGWLIGLLLLVAFLYACVLAYHWFTYGTSRLVNILSLAAYIGGSALIFLILLVSAQNF